MEEHKSMKDRREFLAPGRELILGGVRYEIEGVGRGGGGSAVVYRASYEDGLNQGCRHNVFIKSCFPMTKREGSIGAGKAGSAAGRTGGSGWSGAGRVFIRGTGPIWNFKKGSGEGVGKCKFV